MEMNCFSWMFARWKSGISLIFLKWANYEFRLVNFSIGSAR
jgi:hypothetical protein